MGFVTRRLHFFFLPKKGIAEFSAASPPWHPVTRFVITPTSSPPVRLAAPAVSTFVPNSGFAADPFTVTVTGNTVKPSEAFANRSRHGIFTCVEKAGPTFGEN